MHFNGYFSQFRMQVSNLHDNIIRSFYHADNTKKETYVSDNKNE